MPGGGVTDAHAGHYTRSQSFREISRLLIQIDPCSRASEYNPIRPLMTRLREEAVCSRHAVANMKQRLLAVEKLRGRSLFDHVFEEA